MKPIYVAFATPRLKKDFELLKEGAFEEAKLHAEIEKAISKMKRQRGGIKIERHLWPKEYVRKYGLTNLWKYDLRDGWRLIYTIKSDELMILNIILDWYNHKKYARKFKYKVK